MTIPGQRQNTKKFWKPEVIINLISAFAKILHNRSRLQSFLKTFYYLPVKILQQYDSYNLIDINITKESNSYFVKVDLELIKEEKSKNHSITIKIQMDHKKFTYFTITEGKEI